MLAGGEAAAPSSAEASLQHQRRKTARQCGGVWRGSKQERNEGKQRGAADSRSALGRRGVAGTAGGGAAGLSQWWSPPGCLWVTRFEMSFGASLGSDLACHCSFSFTQRVSEREPRLLRAQGAAAQRDRPPTDGGPPIRVPWPACPAQGVFWAHSSSCRGRQLSGTPARARPGSGRPPWGLPAPGTGVARKVGGGG